MALVMNMRKLCPFGIKDRFYIVLCVVTMVFISIASYYVDVILTLWPDKVVSDTRYYPYNLTFVRDSAMKDVRSIEVEFSRRKVPDLRELLEIEPHVSCMLLIHYRQIYVIILNVFLKSGTF